MRPVRHFRHCPACGLARASEVEASPFRCEGCGFTFFFNATISAAVFLAREDGKLLFVRRARDPGKGLLGPPGGFVDVGERAEAAVRREVLEEVGLEIEDPQFLCSFPNEYLYRGVTYPVLDLFFVARAIRPDSARALEDVDGLEWRDGLREVASEELAFPSIRSALAVWRRGREGSETSRGAD